MNEYHVANRFRWICVSQHDMIGCSKLATLSICNEAFGGVYLLVPLMARRSPRTNFSSNKIPTCILFILLLFQWLGWKYCFTRCKYYLTRMMIIVASSNNDRYNPANIIFEERPPSLVVWGAFSAVLVQPASRSGAGRQFQYFGIIYASENFMLEEKSPREIVVLGLYEVCDCMKYRSDGPLPRRSSCPGSFSVLRLSVSFWTFYGSVISNQWVLLLFTTILPF